MPSNSNQNDIETMPVTRIDDNVDVKSYIAYPKALKRLTARLGTTPEELAAWLFLGPKLGGLSAYQNANELDRPPRFHFEYFTGEDYLSPLMTCWFLESDIDQFVPSDRYISGSALIQRWQSCPGIQPIPYILAKIAESRLLDMHPTMGLTQGSNGQESIYPLLSDGLFALSQILQIEKEDGLEVTTLNSSAELAKTPSTPNDTQPETLEVGSPEWRKQNAKKAANALHDKPGGSRDKQQAIREIWASGKYSSREICAEQECAALDMSFSSARKALINEPDP